MQCGINLLFGLYALICLYMPLLILTCNVLNNPPWQLPLHKTGIGLFPVGLIDSLGRDHRVDDNDKETVTTPNGAVVLAVFTGSGKCFSSVINTSRFLELSPFF